jgi:hypothetical protein
MTLNKKKGPNQIVSMLGGSLLEVARFSRSTTINDHVKKVIIDKANEA